MWPTMLGIFGAIFGLLVGYFLNRNKEQEADWRKMKLACYQEFVLANSGIDKNRETKNAHIRFADAVNAIVLVAPGDILAAQEEFLSENAKTGAERDQKKISELYDRLIRKMREDVWQANTEETPSHIIGTRTLPGHILQLECATVTEDRSSNGTRRRAVAILRIGAFLSMWRSRCSMGRFWKPSIPGATMARSE